MLAIKQFLFGDGGRCRREQEMYTIDSEDLVWVCCSVLVLVGWGCGDAAGLLEILICGAYLVNIFE